MGVYGFDTASYLNSNVSGTSTPILQSAKSTFNSATNLAQFVLRYVSPSPNGTIDQSSSNAINEINAMIAASINYIAPVTSPSQGRIGTGGSTGTAYGDDDATTTGNALKNLYNWVPALLFPTNGIMHVYLDIEKSTIPTSAYTNAWALTLDGFFIGSNSPTNYPLYPCAYVNPLAGTGVCGVLSSYFGVWSNNPEPCSWCAVKFGPTWGPNNCSGLTTLMWQYGEHNACAAASPGCSAGWPANVDIDMIASSSELSQMMFV